jgi:hypothetical protein
MPPSDPAASDCLVTFLENAWPTLLGSIRRWHGLSLRMHADLFDDLRQELAADYLAHRAHIERLPEQERHERWFRLLNQQLYWLVLRGRRRCSEAHLERIAGGDTATTPLDDLVEDADREQLLQLLQNRVPLKNGRLNLTESAKLLGMSMRELRALLARASDALGYGDSFLRFWQRRLLEALVGLAADLLNDHGQLRVHAEERRTRADPEGRLLRIRRIRAWLGARLLPHEFRRLLRRYGRRRSTRGLDPWAVLQDAGTLAADDPAVLLWRFEAAVATGRARDAARTLRRARAQHVSEVPVVLARARLLEARGREGAALALLRRAQQRHPRDLRITDSLAQLRLAMPSSDCSVATSSSSSPGSPPIRDHCGSVNQRSSR